MAIEKKELKDVSSGIRQAYAKAQDVIKKRNTEYGIELLKGIIQKSPGFMDARETLRNLEREKSDNMGFFGKFMANMKSSKYLMKSKASAKKSPKDALNAAEEALALYLYSPSALSCLADAAIHAEAYFIGIEAMELARELHPDNEGILKKLADIYKLDGNGPMVLSCMQKLADMDPNNLEKQQAVRAAAAQAQIQNNWEGKESFTDIMDKDQVVQGQKMETVARNEDDINNRIQGFEAKIAAGDDSIEPRRHLADLYLRAKRYDDAIATYNWIAEKMGVFDPAIDHSIEKANVGIMDLEIEQAAGDEAKVQEIEQRKYDYRLERAEDRVKNYPNDLQLRYELASIYYDGGATDQALEQFQTAQRNPQRQQSCMVYMGRCFHAKKQYDMAVEQFEKATEKMLVMDKEKMAAMYYFGLLYEDMGQHDNAMHCFKEIYQTNVNYRDVKARMDAFYAQQSE